MKYVRMNNDIQKKLAMLKYIRSEQSALITTKQQWLKIGIYEELGKDTHIDERIEELEKQCNELTAFIDSIPDVTIRKIARMRFKEGRTWKEITKAVYGGYYSSSAARIQLHRYINRMANSKNESEGVNNDKN